MSVTTAKVFMNGGSQAVRLPKEYRFDSEEVVVESLPGNRVLLSAMPVRLQSWEEFFAAFEAVPDFERPAQGAAQERDWGGRRK